MVWQQTVLIIFFSINMLFSFICLAYAHSQMKEKPDLKVVYYFFGVYLVLNMLLSAFTISI